jgi:hypothetical protein
LLVFECVGGEVVFRSQGGSEGYFHPLLTLAALQLHPGVAFWRSQRLAAMHVLTGSVIVFKNLGAFELNIAHVFRLEIGCDWMFFIIANDKVSVRAKKIGFVCRHKKTGTGWRPWHVIFVGLSLFYRQYRFR